MVRVGTPDTEDLCLSCHFGQVGSLDRFSTGFVIDQTTFDQLNGATLALRHG
jgi:hypothetical protein